MFLKVLAYSVSGFGGRGWEGIQGTEAMEGNKGIGEGGASRDHERDILLNKLAYHFIVHKS